MGKKEPFQCVKAKYLYALYRTACLSKWCGVCCTVLQLFSLTSYFLHTERRHLSVHHGCRPFWGSEICSGAEFVEALSQKTGKRHTQKNIIKMCSILRPQATNKFSSLKEGLPSLVSGVNLRTHLLRKNFSKNLSSIRRGPISFQLCQIVHVRSIVR